MEILAGLHHEGHRSPISDHHSFSQHTFFQRWWRFAVVGGEVARLEGVSTHEIKRACTEGRC